LDAFQFQVVAGLLVGLVVGLTGVGGGSLMTPILVLGFGIPPHIAVGTDLLYAAITKTCGSVAHYFSGKSAALASGKAHDAATRHIDWRVLGLLGSGSISAALLTAWWLSHHLAEGALLATTIKTVLGVALLLTAAAIVLRTRLVAWSARHPAFRQHRDVLTVVLGLLIGAMVTISSVGAGAVGVAALALLYPEKRMVEIVGTDIAHAVPLTLIAGLAHAKLGGVDLHLLAALLIGGLPGITLGSRLSALIDERYLRALLTLLLTGLGAKLIA
jgi:uncharacterized protein